MLSSHLRLGLFPSGLHIKTLYAPVSHTCHMPCPSYSSWLHLPVYIWSGIAIIKLLVMYSSPLPCYLVSLRSKYLPQHSIVEHPQPKSLILRERRSFTPIQNSGQNCNSVQLYIFGYQTGRPKILLRKIAAIPRLRSALNFFMNGILICYSCSQLFELFQNRYCLYRI